MAGERRFPSAISPGVAAVSWSRGGRWELTASAAERDFSEFKLQRLRDIAVWTAGNMHCLSRWEYLSTHSGIVGNYRGLRLPHLTSRQTL